MAALWTSALQGWRRSAKPPAPIPLVVRVLAADGTQVGKLPTPEPGRPRRWLPWSRRVNAHCGGTFVVSLEPAATRRTPPPAGGG